MKKTVWATRELRQYGKKPEKAGPGRRVIYLCLPFEGDVGDYLDRVKEMSRILDPDKNILLFPYLIPIMDEGLEGKAAVIAGRQDSRKMIDLCDEFWVRDDRLTANVLAELAQAVKSEKKIQYLCKEEVDEDELQD